MNKLILFTLFAGLFLGISAQAQIIITENFFEGVRYNIKAEVRDSLSNEPIPFASVYLKHPKDTVITNFALTDTLGKVELTDVAKGDHLVCVEFMGYKPFQKRMFIRKSIDLKVLRLQMDRTILDAAKVTAAGRPIEVRQDTIIYNASAFKTLSNDNLAQLLKKMPGIEVGSDGTVKVNGKAVSKITVGGKTFFMGNNKAALDNLPAKIVDKVKVIDKESETAQFSGINDAEKQKVMDIELKEEYKKGWFGNLKLGAGRSVPGKSDNEFLENRDFLYSGNGMFSAYGENTQLTAIAGAGNIIENDSGVIIIGTGDDAPSLGFDGIHSRRNGGVNINSNAIKGLESNASLIFNSDNSDTHKRTDRTTFREGKDNLFNTSESFGAGKMHKLTARVEIENKKKDKYLFKFSPNISFLDYVNQSRDTSSTRLGDALQNHSKSYNFEKSRSFAGSFAASAGIKDIGKKRRALTFNANGSLEGNKGEADENSNTTFDVSGTETKRYLHYDKKASVYFVRSGLNYVEPIGENWAVNTSLISSYKVKKSANNAFNGNSGTANEYYSSISGNRYFTNMATLLAQYSQGRNSVQIGASGQFYKSENYAKSYGLDTRTGVDEWLSVFSPFIRVNAYDKNKNRYSIWLNSETTNPAASSIVPTFNIVNPTRISAGNIYLKPVSTYYVSLNTYGNIRKKGSWNMYLSNRIISKGEVSAVWFDENSIRYSIPVNTQKPTYNCYFGISANYPLLDDGLLRFSYNGDFNLSKTTSYQSKAPLAGINIDAFDYTSFMASFWGDEHGNRFYSGLSGFRESSTKNKRIWHKIDFSSTIGDFQLKLAASILNNSSEYSLDPRANTNVWHNLITFEPTYASEKGYQIRTVWAYNMRKGYGAGYDENYLQWNMSVSKNIKAFTFSITGNDLLNSRRSYTHDVSEEYVQDSYTNTIGRYILFSITWNFGKMNASKSGAAQQAMWNMLW